MIRDRHLLINSGLLQQLRLVAELQNIDCAETVAEMWIRERLETMPEILDRARRREVKRKEADAEWRAHWKIGDAASKQAA